MFKISKLLIIFLLLVTCTSCNKKNDNYTINAWLKDLALRAGIINQRDVDNEILIDELVNWKIIKDDHEIELNDGLRFEFLAYTLSNLLGENDTFNSYEFNSVYNKEINNFLSYGLTTINEFKAQDKITSFKANEILEKAISIINNQEFKPSYSIKLDDNLYYEENKLNNGNNYLGKDYEIEDLLVSSDKVYEVISKKNNDYELVEVSYEDIINNIEISDTFEVDFNNAYIEDYYSPIDSTSNIYNDSNFKRQAKLNFSKSFEVDGYKISYNTSLNKLHLHISKKTNRGINVYYDGDIYDIKPTFKWKYNNSIIEDAYFKVNFKTNNEVGMSVGKYKTLYGDFKEFNSKNLYNSIRNILKEKTDIVDTSFTICKIHVPIPQCPILEFTVELKVNFYISGKVDVVLDGSFNTGLEIKNNHLRTIYDQRLDIDSNIKASANATTSLDFALELLRKDLVNFKTNFGINSHALATIHLYEDNGNIKTEKTNNDYDILSEYQNDDKVFVCGDLSLSWILNMEFNHSNSLANSIGLYKKFDILDEKDQIFKNKNHIENGHFVDKCTRKNNVMIDYNRPQELNPNRIVLENYSIVLKKANEKIGILSLPKGYQLTDLNFESDNVQVVSVNNKGEIKRIKPGVSKIRIYTKDGKYEIYLNVLVSDETLSYYNLRLQPI